MSDKKKLFEKFKEGKSRNNIIKWILTGFVSLGALSLLIVHFSTKENSDISLSPDRKALSLDNKDSSLFTSRESAYPPETKTSYKPVFYNTIPTGLGVQMIKNILKENGDCTSPIAVTDSILFSPHSPKGFGNITEIKDNKSDDTLYFEEEHNTVWYKFIAKESGNLTFDIIPLIQSDDYDFILYRYNGKDFYSKAINKAVKPIRTCISRNDKKIKSMTGLSLDESSKNYIHSGRGASYVKYVRVKKGDIFYLLVDNVNSNGNGHSIRFHYRTFAPGEYYVGLELPFNQIKFMDSDYLFKPGSEKALDSLFQFMLKNPTIKIEIDGHVNSSGGQIVEVRRGESYTDLELSQKRAIAIYEFLVKKGIDRNRIFCKGYGSSRMKIPNAKTPKECQVNIRAEIIIMSVDYKKDME